MRKLIHSNIGEFLNSLDKQKFLMHSQKSKRTSYLLDYNKIGIGLFICATGK